MSLDLGKLEKVAELANGIKRARCPACAEQGQDGSGEHLRIYPDGKFGCCVFPGSREHRKRIFALAGEHTSRGIEVRTALERTGGLVRRVLLGRISRNLADAAESVRPWDAWDGEARVQQQSRELPASGTAGTGGANSKGETGLGAGSPLFKAGDSGTPGTGFENSRAYLKEVGSTQKEFHGGVPGVPRTGAEEQPPNNVAKEEKLPYIDSGGGLVIPFDSPARYHYWRPDGKRMSVKETLAEVRERMAHVEGDENHGTEFDPEAG